MKNTDLITGDYFALADANASNPNNIYMIAENGGNNYAPLITTNNPSMKNRIGDYFPIESTNEINYIPYFHFLLPTTVDIYSPFKHGFPFNNSHMFKQGNFWIFNDNLYLTINEYKHLNLIIHSKNPDLIGTITQEYYDLHYERSQVFKSDFIWLMPEGGFK